MYHWQDIVFAVGSLVFSAALIPSVRGTDKPAFISSALTALILAVYAFTFATLSLWFSTFATTLNCVVWSTLAVQKLIEVRAATSKKS